MPQRHKAQVNAFNLVPVVEQVLPDRTKTEVECIAISDKNLYVGTADGNIIFYQLEEKRSPLGKTLYQSKVKNRIQLGADKRRPVQQLTAVSAQKRLLALMDGMLYLMNMSTLELYDTGQRVTKLQCYCVNESKSQQPTSANFEIIVAPQRRKQIQQYILSGERLVHVKDYSIPEPALTMARDGNAVCVALSGQEGKYVIIKLLEGSMFDLLAYETGCTPIVKRMGKGEFLVNGGTFGITTSVTGISNRPPVEWGAYSPRAATYVFPYVVAWIQESSVINVYNLVHQRCVQEIPFLNGRFMGEFSGKLYAALDKSVYLLLAVPLKDQVSDLLEKQLVEEAVLLAETIAAVEASKSSTTAEEYMNEVKLRAAFIYLSTGSFSQAETLFHESLCDPREVIMLFEDLLPRNSTFQSSTSSLHGLPSMQVLAASSDQISLREAKKFLIRYLKEVRTTPLALGRREDIDTSLVKLLAEDHSSSLIPYITNHDLYLSFEETKQALEESQCYHALALLYYYSNQSSEALKIWTKIYDKELTDAQFPGFGYIIEFLSKCTTAEVVLHYAEWALARDQEQAVRVFTERKEEKESLEPAFVLNFLKPFPVATVAYLEHIINDKKSKEEAFHTQLAGCYLHELLELRGGGVREREITRARIKLSGFLESSTCYDPACLLTEVQDTDMYRECAILYGRMEEHEKALSLLAHKLKDHSSAQDYCLLHSKGKGRLYRQNLHQILLRVYLSPKDTSQKVLIEPALTLLNAHGAHFDAAQVLELLPHEWPIVTVKAFLLHSVRGGMEASHTAKVECSLAKGENIQVRQKYISLQGDPIVITDNTRCPVCHLPFSDAAFVRYPNGVITHLKCGRNKTICPVTGTWFGEI